MGNVLKDFDFSGKSAGEITSVLKQLLVPYLVERMPEIAGKSLLILYGSALRGEIGEGSDVDVMLFLPQKILQTQYRRIQHISQDVWEDCSVDITTQFSLESLLSDFPWKNDFLLSVLEEAVPLYDPQQIFPARQQKFGKFPPEVLRDKIISAGWMVIQSLALLERRVARNDLLGAITIRTRLVKLSLILLHLRHGLFYDNRLYQSVESNPQMRFFADLTENCLKTIADGQCDAYLVELVRAVQQEIVIAGLLPADFYATWQPWNHPLKYPVLLSWI